jgi:hypothetical protein
MYMHVSVANNETVQYKYVRYVRGVQRILLTSLMIVCFPESEVKLTYTLVQYSPLHKLRVSPYDGRV